MAGTQQLGGLSCGSSEAGGGCCGLSRGGGAVAACMSSSVLLNKRTETMSRCRHINTNILGLYDPV